MLGYLKEALGTEEQLPIYSHELPGSRRGLQALTWPLKFKLERAGAEETLKDLSGTMLRMEPIATGQDLYGWLQGQVIKKWYEGRDRTSLEFVTELIDRRDSKVGVLQIDAPGLAEASQTLHRGLLPLSSEPFACCIFQDWSGG